MIWWLMFALVLRMTKKSTTKRRLSILKLVKWIIWVDSIRIESNLVWLKYLLNGKRVAYIQQLMPIRPLKVENTFVLLIHWKPIDCLPINSKDNLSRFFYSWSFVLCTLPWPYRDLSVIDHGRYHDHKWFKLSLKVLF